jgi:hypothetical protein
MHHSTRPSRSVVRRVEIGFCLVKPPDERAGVDISRGPGDCSRMTQNRVDPPWRHIGISANNGTFTA